MLKNKSIKNNIIIYQTKNGAIEFHGDFFHETIWVTQAQIAYLFGVERSVVTKHIRNIFNIGELSEKSVCAIFAQERVRGSVEGIVGNVMKSFHN